MGNESGQIEKEDLSPERERSLGKNNTKQRQNRQSRVRKRKDPYSFRSFSMFNHRFKQKVEQQL